MKARVLVLTVTFIALSVAIIARLFYWQVVKSNDLTKEGQLQHRSGQVLGAKRGSILANDQSPLAASDVSWLLFIDKPNLKDSPKKIANTLAPFLTNEQLLPEVLRIENLLSGDGVWIPVKHKLPSETKENISALGISGLGFEQQEQRTYPEASSSAHVLGFVGKNENGQDTGYFGLEGYYDSVLKGKSGFSQKEKDARGIPILIGDSKEIAPVPGSSLVTYIDKRIQFLIEEKLKKGLENYGASEGTVIVMDPKSGGIMGMASFPSYDPAKYFDYTNELFKNPSISNAFEPGSIFKPLVMAAALDSGVIKTDTLCDICGGPVEVDKYSIETWNKEYRENSTMQDIIVHSDNVGMTFVGGKLGVERMYDYLTNYGLGSQTGIDLQGEASPVLRKKNTWNIVDLATASFGQGVAVTPIQMVKAFSAIANDGVVASPQVVAKITREDWEEEVVKDQGKKVLSKQAADEVTAMMVAAVKNGESKWIQARGFSVAGKTGTAQIPVSGHYDEEKTIASFIGFAPADNPKFLMLVTLREPQTSPWASETAAPVWFSIAKELFLYLGVQPDN